MLSKLFHPQFVLDENIILHINNLLNAAMQLFNNSLTAILQSYSPSYATILPTGATTLERKSWKIYTLIKLKEWSEKLLYTKQQFCFVIS